MVVRIGKLDVDRTKSLLKSEKVDQMRQGQDEARKRFRHAAITSVLVLFCVWCGALVLGAWHHDGRVPGGLCISCSRNKVNLRTHVMDRRGYDTYIIYIYIYISTCSKLCEGRVIAIK